MRKYIAFLFLIFFSCSKDPSTDYSFIYPLPYLPVYPGSYWRYLDESGDTVKQSSGPEYQLHSYPSAALNGIRTDPAFVPFWNGIPVYGYSTPDFTTSSSSDGMKQVGYLSEQLNQSWTLSESQYGSSWRKVVNIDTSISVNALIYDHVIKVSEFGGSYVGTQYFVHLYNSYYYAKNIGLIAQEKITNDTVIVRHLELISYFIND